MSDWTLVPCLDRLRGDFNEVAPGRDRTSDGTIGDTAHADGGNSDHLPDEDFPKLRDKDADSRNEVHAIDVDVDLREPGLTMEMVVQHLVARSKAGLEDRLRNIIFNRRIWAASSDWVRQPYTGPNPHDKHAHFSASYTTKAEADTRSWHLEDIPVALTADDRKFITGEITRIVDARVDLLTTPEKPSADGERENPIGRAALTQPIPNPLQGKRTDAWVLLEDIAEAIKGLTPPPVGK